MLNISEKSIKDELDLSSLKSNKYNDLPRANKMLSWWLYCLLGITLIVFFLPWTQNIQLKGKVTTLLPEQRPQNINATIAGRIEKWYVKEGDLVKAGDTIAFLSEIKEQYLDPELVDRTQNQIDAKYGSIGGYNLKINALESQIENLKSELKLKKQQLEQKVEQAKLQQGSYEAAIQRAKVDYETAVFQQKRMDTLYRKGIKSLNDLESRTLKVQEARAKLVAAENKYKESANDISIAELQLQSVVNEYNYKIAKADSDKFTTMSSLYNEKADLNKLKNQHENYVRRNDMYYIIAPQPGYITKAVVSGIGEIVKEGQTIVTVVPYERQLAVEVYVKPLDLPLINIGTEVRLVFDGWQAFMVSGWSEFSFGTYEGKVAAIDNIPNDNQRYRVLIQSNDEEKPFPSLLRVGAGAQGVALLNNVPVWYEIWRQLNGFPAEFYQNDVEMNKDLFKAPLKAVAK